MLKNVYLEKFYKKYDLNCAENVLYACNDFYNLNICKNDLKLAAGFGGGMGIESTCGAVTGGIMALSKIFITDVAHESDLLKNITIEYLDMFKDEMKSLNCDYLKENYRDENEGCKNVIISSLNCLEKVIYNHKNDSKIILPI